MKRTKSAIFATLLAISLIAGACAANDNTNQSESAGTETQKSGQSGKASAELGNTYWTLELEASDDFGARKIELFLFEDGTFHSRDYRESYYGFNGYYAHHPAEESKWRLDGEDLELEFLTHSPDKRVIYNAKYTGDEITVSDFLGELEPELVLKKQDTIPTLSNIEDDSLKLKGEWVEVVHEDNDGTFIMVEDYFTPSVLQVTEEGKDMTASYTHSRTTVLGDEISDNTFVDAKILLKDEPLFEGSLNEFWHAELTDATEANPENAPTKRTLTLVNDDMLILEQEWVTPSDTGAPLQNDQGEAASVISAQETSDSAAGENESEASEAAGESDAEVSEAAGESDVEASESAGESDAADHDTEDELMSSQSDFRYSTQVFLRKDSEAYKNREEMRYRSTHTVSNVHELVEAIDSNTKIILKEGVYNLSDLQEGNDFDISATLNLYSRNNLCLEAEEGKTVEIVTEDTALPVITMDFSNNIKLKGLTLGHVLALGYCSGSVFSSYDSKYVTIEDCHLYGCGTYGVEARYTNHLIVDRTEIYECTYGLLSLADCSNIAVKNSTLRDSADLMMFDTISTDTFLIEDTKITNNTSSFSSDKKNVFISNQDGQNHLFRNCEFSGNKYDILSEGDVGFENCTFNDNVQ